MKRYIQCGLLQLIAILLAPSLWGCTYPPTQLTISYTWPPGAFISVTPANFASNTPVQTAYLNWNDALATYFPCLPIGFQQLAGNASVNVNHTAIPLSGGKTVRGLTHLDHAIFGPTNRLSHVDIDIDTGVTSNAAITDVLMHELGHTFGLGDCNGCAIGTTVMVPEVTISSEKQVIGASTPTTCDLFEVGRIATDYPCQIGCNRPANCPESCLPLCNGSCKCSPIVLDTTGAGFKLTSISSGVPFRLLPGGPRYQMSWTEAGSGNGWLVLDRNHNGIIDDFTEMFGNLTPQPITSTPNGFVALALFDQVNNGGNGNGRIDPGDAVYEDLRIWIDENQNGISEPNELHSLPELGMFSISLRIHSEQYEDDNGNLFRFKARVTEAARDNVCYDVFLQIATSGSRE